MPLTDLTCKKANPKDKPYKLSDSGGLYLEVSPKGNKWWRLKYRLHGKEKRISLGVYPSVTLLAARDQREAYKKKIASGVDPLHERKEDKILSEYKARQTVELVFTEWHANTKAKWSADYAAELLNRLENDIFP